MIGYLILGALAVMIASRKQNGVGKIKVWQCIEKAQRNGVQFGDKWDRLTNDEQRVMELIANNANYKQTRKSYESGKEYGEAFYNFLNNKYKSVAGLGKVAIEYPYIESQVHNENGDLILLHRDYDRERDIKNAIDAVSDMLTTDPAFNGYVLTLQYIAEGGKVVWKSLTKGGDVIRRGLEDDLFGSGHPAERKLRRKILGTEKSGAKYPEQLAHEFAERNGGSDTDYKNGVLDALMQVDSKQQAQEELLSLYYDTFFKKEIPDGMEEYNSAPF